MIAAIADTHTTIWYLFSDPRLGSGASAFIDEAASKGEMSAFQRLRSSRSCT
jgi:PIN domain nuclease of toxin-antitoxin system